MIEFDSRQQAQSRSTIPVTVIGIGGAGANVLDTIALDGLPDARLVALNTDVRALQNSMLGTKIQLGKDLTQGLGAGGDPELGAEAALASEADIREELRGQEMVFICAGLGGGTGSGAAPLVARLAREEGAFVVVFATMPFTFEGRRRVRQATESLETLRQNASALVTFDNDRIGELVLPKKGIQEAFAAADRVVSQSIRAIINLVTQPGLIRIGMDDLITALRNEDSRCLFGYGLAKGDQRVQEALTAALRSPLLNEELLREKARNVLVHVCGGSDMTFQEVQDLMKTIGGKLHDDAQILFGTGTDAKLGDQLSVTLISSLSRDGGNGGDGGGGAPAPAPTPAPVQAAPAPAPAPAQVRPVQGPLTGAQRPAQQAPAARPAAQPASPPPNAPRVAPSKPSAFVETAEPQLVEDIAGVVETVALEDSLPPSSRETWESEEPVGTTVDEPIYDVATEETIVEAVDEPVDEVVAEQAVVETVEAVEYLDETVAEDPVTEQATLEAEADEIVAEWPEEESPVAEAIVEMPTADAEAAFETVETAPEEIVVAEETEPVEEEPPAADVTAVFEEGPLASADGPSQVEELMAAFASYEETTIERPAQPLAGEPQAIEPVETVVEHEPVAEVVAEEISEEPEAAEPIEAEAGIEPQEVEIEEMVAEAVIEEPAAEEEIVAVEEEVHEEDADMAFAKNLLSTVHEDDADMTVPPRFEHPAETESVADKAAPLTPPEPEQKPAPAPVPAGPRRFNLRDIAQKKGTVFGRGDTRPPQVSGSRPTSKPVAPSSKPSKPLFFQNWRREEKPTITQPVAEVEPEPQAVAEVKPAPAPAPAAKPNSPFTIGNGKEASAKSGSPALATAAEQQTFEETLQAPNRGRFEKVAPTLEGDQNLDIPTFLRRKTNR